jgi:hypothetical protein
MLRKLLLVAALFAASPMLCASEAAAQCAPRDLIKTLGNTRATSAIAPSGGIKSDVVGTVWKTITLGNFANSFALRNALDAAGCDVGDLAEEIIARPAFTLAPTKTVVDLIAAPAAEFGLTAESAALEDIYSRAEKLGLSLVPAEVGPELRLQYLDQPIGEFLHVGMKPITTWNGDPVIFVIANGGAGLILIGQHASADTQIPTSAVFLFVRPPDTPELAQVRAPAR